MKKVTKKSKKTVTVPYSTEVLHQYNTEDLDGDFFFDGNVLITYIDGNDGNYRNEYMDCLFQHFGIAVKRLTKLNKVQHRIVADFIRDQIGDSEEEGGIGEEWEPDEYWHPDDEE